MPEDIEPFNGPVSRPPAGWKSSEARFEEVILGPELLHPLIEEVHLGGQGPTAGYLESPAIVSEAGPADNEE